MKRIGADETQRGLQRVGLLRSAAALGRRLRRAAAGAETAAAMRHRAPAERRTLVLRESAVEGLLERIGDPHRIEVEILIAVDPAAIHWHGVLHRGALLMTPAFMLSPHVHDTRDWLGLAMVSSAIALLASVAGNALWNSASRRLPLTMTGQMVIFETLFALLYAFIWEQRLPSLLEVGAIAALITAVLWCVSSHRMPRPHE